ncbi:beta-D-xylosidase 4 [Rhynchospora pubera]|uniref:Beta-D-xylosidase 4 n=1 Tax=Rhynchospora pubera TaxID=906938 RepID=A0AAV8CVB6_9POAL|nr:beta-D-xylosidase 4 [Rhynchospora pubera]
MRNRSVDQTAANRSEADNNVNQATIISEIRPSNFMKHRLNNYLRLSHEMFDEIPKPVRSLLSLLSLLLLIPLSSCTLPNRPCASSGAANAFPFCNSSLPLLTRAESLVSLLTLDEKIKQLSNTADAVPRLGLPAYEWWSEALHGLCANGPGVLFNGSIRAATVFPQIILTAASFNRTLWREVARAIAEEARAMHNVGQAGLTFWAPNINIFRDPRWGRGQETPGEDPLTVSTFAVEYVKGFQHEDDNGGLMLSACCKHFTAYDLEKWNGSARYTFNAKVTEQDMEDTFQPPFKSCITEGHASCLMCAYNQVNGVPSCAREDLLNQARDEWGFEGYITSDCDAVAIIYENQTYSSSPEESIADVLKAGMDINCGTYLLRHTKSAIEKGKIEEEDINRALLNLFTVQLRLGRFNAEQNNQWFERLGHTDVCTENHRNLALEATRQGLVLLKNENGFLPLKRQKVESIAVIGPAGNDTDILGGDYTGIPCRPVSILEGIQDYIENTIFVPGCQNVSCNSTSGFDLATDIARNSDYVILVAGLSLTEETEDLDRVSLLLPGKQMQLVNTISSVTKRPIVLVLIGGGPIDVSFAKENKDIGGIIWIGYPGEVGGQVLAEVLFGDYNPDGRLPITWYPESFTNVPMSDMNMRPDPSRSYPGRTYRFYTGETVYKFGYGLSYSNFSYKFLSAPDKLILSLPYIEMFHMGKIPDYVRTDGPDHVYIKDISSCQDLKFSVRVSVFNHGGMNGAHTVLLFVRHRSNLTDYPVKQLIGFERVHASVGETTEVEIFVDPCKHISVANKQGKRRLLLGPHVLMLEDLEHEFYIQA